MSTGRRKALMKAQQQLQPHASSFSSKGEIPHWDEQHQSVIHFPTFSTKGLPFGAVGHASSVRSCGTTTIVFPLCPSHLLTLIQINVIRACHANARLLGQESSTDCTKGALRLPIPPSRHEHPDTLTPTALQSQVPHKTWIDVLPDPVWRDNFIRALGTFDERELCNDLVGGLFENTARQQDEDRQGVVVWSPSWHIDGWELSEGFIRKWGWSIVGCYNILAATNKWRATRGEHPVRVCQRQQLPVRKES